MRKQQTAALLMEHYPYKLYYWEDMPEEPLLYVRAKRRRGKNKTGTYNDCFIMADTETSKKRNSQDNHVVAWTISIRTAGVNLFTIWGRRPSEMIEAFNRLSAVMPGTYTYVYFHNLSYDWQFLRKFMFRSWGTPEKQLNTKTHYPINIQFPNGVILRDSLILAQRTLDRWARDMNVTHKKAVGKWDYDKLRNQRETFTADELEYIEHDTLAGVECLDATADFLGKDVYSMPYTATGIPREQVRKIGEDNRAHDRFERMAPDYFLYRLQEILYHGGYTHTNRYLINWILNGVSCKDFASSYPFCMIAHKLPMERFVRIETNWTPEKILSESEDYAFILILKMVHPHLKTYTEPMPVLQFSKCSGIINPISDNGRILEADYAEIIINEIDLDLIMKQYDFDEVQTAGVYVAKKDYLPSWFTDYIFARYEDKCRLKTGDPVSYSIAKATVNSLYGMCVQKAIKDDIIEDYETGDYTIEEKRTSETYEQYLHKWTSVLPYQWGIWVTSYAMHNLFYLGACCETWVYSDTDSVYGIGWDEDKVKAYNDRCKRMLEANGYGPVVVDGREYWLGVAEDDKRCIEFKALGAKRYAYRDKDGLHITVAGVPKKGAACLNDDISNFKKGFVFPGTSTGKLQHTYLYVDEIYIDEDGNETGDSIDLNPCDYLLDAVDVNPEYIEEGIYYYGSEEDRLL